MVWQVESLNFASKLYFEVGAIEASDFTDTTFRSADVVPHLGNFTTERCDEAQASDDDSFQHDSSILPLLDVVNRITDCLHCLVVFIRD